ncbi:1-pyrroline-5-carboxylate dehydrogenase [Polychaeton citri CBS 116435]|uniref:Multifunctional fusion protein n=1 Tax=Polychaeton citri CBS 116435 TaxID=1314669 RepID=A0A9P4Q424_9PEZI|nr:1-pyrroline-5-carboxylate dehydrogenase [Polychaeton citri CBS 116435]
MNPALRSLRLRQTPRFPRSRLQGARCIATGGHFSVPKSYNENNLHYAPSSPEREHLAKALEELKAKLPVQVPAIGGPANATKGPNGDLVSMTMPAKHGTVFAQFPSASKAEVESAIDRALKAKTAWQEMPFTDRAAIFLRAAELVSDKYRYELMAATMLGQGKNAWQAEIDAAAELADFYRFNVGFAQEIYDKQPTINSPAHHGRTDYRPLEGFVYAVSPFNFTAIGGNLISAPALLGNVVVWKPSPMSVYPSHLVHQILLEAGLPKDVIQLVNGDAETVTDTVLARKEFSALNFIGSSDVFRSLYGKIGQGVAEHKYREFPRMVGETSGKNFHLIHPTADVPNAARHTIRSSFEYAGQKCSAASRIYLPESQAKNFLTAIKKELEAVKVGDPEEFKNFLGPVINKASFDKISKAMDEANKDESLELAVGGKYDGSTGYYIEPTIYVSKNAEHALFDKELFGPVLIAHVYPDAEFDTVLETIDKQGGGFALTGSIFASDQEAIRKAENKLRYSAGNFYVNCKTTGAVIGQQSFGGSRGSGTCDKAGSAGFMMRFTAPRTLKEEYNKLHDVLYPSNY